jgi:hypothetical protein
VHVTEDDMSKLDELSGEELKQLLRCVGAAIRGDTSTEHAARASYHRAKRQRESRTITVRGEVRS